MYEPSYPFKYSNLPYFMGLTSKEDHLQLSLSSSFCVDSIYPIKWRPFNRIKIKLYGEEILYRNAVGYLRRAAEWVYFLSTENEHLWTHVKRAQSRALHTYGRIIWGLRSFLPGEEIHAKKTKHTLKGRWYLFHR